LYPVSASYQAAVRAGGQQRVRVDAYRSGALLAGGADLAVVGGTVTDDSTPGVRRQLDLELLPVPGLWDLLSPIGTQLRVSSVLRYPSGQTESVPMGVFDLDSATMGYGVNGSLTCKGSDKWVLIQRARFLTPFASTASLSITDQIIELIRHALGPNEPVVVNATSTAFTGSHVWDRDRDKAIIELADSIGAYVYFDRNGVATIDDAPALHDRAPAWSVDASANGVLLDADRARDRSKTYNVVVVTGEKVDGQDPWPPQIVFDSDPLSPTFAGTNPASGANVPGPFGVVPYFYSSPLLSTANQGNSAGEQILARVTGLNAQLSLTQVRNHALDSLDVVQVVLPKERFDLPRPVEVHIIDKITHPLSPSGTQSLETRATRTDEVSP
jgi:hypothetical protein